MTISTLDGRFEHAGMTISTLDARFEHAGMTISTLDGRFEHAGMTISTLDGRFEYAGLTISTLDGRFGHVGMTVNTKGCPLRTRGPDDGFSSFPLVFGRNPVQSFEDTFHFMNCFSVFPSRAIPSRMPWLVALE
jgi:hypothetical protein